MKQSDRKLCIYYNHHHYTLLVVYMMWLLSMNIVVLGIRIPDRIQKDPKDEVVVKTAVFGLGSFWRSESVFGCLDGVVRTAVGYAGGSKTNPEYRSLGDHAECVKVLFYSLSRRLCFHAKNCSHLSASSM